MFKKRKKATVKKVKVKRIAVALEIHGDAVKLCYASFFDTGPVLRVFTRILTSRDEGSVADAIKDMFGTLHIYLKTVLLAIPKHLVMTRVLYLPSTNGDEIRNMVSIESAKHVPYTEGDRIVDYKILERLKNGYSNVLLAIAQASTVHRYLDIVKKAGLKTEKVALGAECLTAWYATMIEKRQEKGTTALVNIDSEYVDIVIIKGGTLKFTRAFACQPESAATDKSVVFEEIRKSLVAYSRQINEEIDKILVSGAKKHVSTLEPLLAETGIPLEVIPQTEGITIAECKETDLEERSFLELAGLLCKENAVKINLLPEPQRQEGEYLRLKKSLTKTGILIACIALILVAIAVEGIIDKMRFVNLLDRKLETMAPQVELAKRMRNDMKVIKSEIQKKPLAIDILSEIYKITPSGMTYNLVDYESSKNLILRGSAPSLDKVIKFITTLESSGYFKNVKLKYTTKRNTGSAQITDFEIVCQLVRL